MQKTIEAHRGSMMPSAISNWQPKWRAITQGGSEVGVMIDDHCFVVLSTNEDGQWHPTCHIPSVVAQLIGQLVNQGLLDY